MTRPSHAAWMVARIGGVPADRMASFHSEPLLEWGRRYAELLAERDGQRTTLVAALHARIGGARRTERRFLLAVKRDLHNARPLDNHRDHALWPLVEEVCGPSLAQHADLEARLETMVAEAEATYRSEEKHQQQDLLALFDDPALTRGVALASPALVERLTKTRVTGFTSHRRSRKLETSLIRFASRAALKLSPYSTLTRLAVGRVDFGVEGPRTGLVGAPWTTRTRLRLKPFVFNQIHAALLGHRPYRSRLRIHLNGTVERIEGNRYQFLKPGRWQFDPDQRKPIYRQEVFVKVNLEGTLIAWLVRELGEQPMPYRDVLARVAACFGHDPDEPGLAELLDKLLDIGFLGWSRPWRNDATSIAASLVDTLRTLPPDDRLEACIDSLETIEALTVGYQGVDDPAAFVRRIRRQVRTTWAALGGLLGIDAGHEDASRASFYEDVMITPDVATSTPAASSPITTVHTSGVEPLFERLTPLFDVSYLFNPAHEWAHIIQAFGQRRWPEREEVGVLELFAALQPIWKQYQPFAVDAAEPQGWRETFDPLELEGVDTLRRLRAQVAETLDACAASDGRDLQISGVKLASIVDCIPPRYRAPLGPCLFVQSIPPDGTQRTWVLNRMYEGTGRYSSRFSMVMDPIARARYRRQMMEASEETRIEGESVRLLDLARPYGDTLNVHASQTPAWVDLSGDYAPSTEEGHVALRDLQVPLAAPSGPLGLRDEDGARYLPTHLGTMNLGYMPPLYQFLALLGLGTMRTIFPQRPSRTMNGINVLDRLVLGDVVLQRRRWFIPVDLVREVLGGREGCEAFLVLDRWRTEVGIPDQVFWIEKVHFEGLENVHKPQFLDFSSPLFLRLFLTGWRHAERLIVLEEALPAAQGHVGDDDGNTWALELQLEAIAMDRNRRAARRPILPSMTRPEVATASAS